MIKKYILLIFVLCIYAVNNYAQSIDTTGLKMWLRSDTGIVIQTGKVVQWKDCSNHHNHCVQADTSMAPSKVLNIAAIGNQSSVLFDGANDHMDFTNTIGDIRTVFFIIKKNGSNIGFEPILGDLDAGSSIDFLGATSGPEIFNSTYVVPNINGGSVRINANPISGVLNALKPTNYSIVTITTAGNVTAGRLTRDRIFNDRVWKGEYSEVIIYNRLLSQNGIDSIENYLVKKYSPVVDLGPDITITPTIGCQPSNSVTISANPNFQNYLWSNGDTSYQTNVNQYGSYSVICTDIFGKQHFDTIRVIPTPKNFNYPANILCHGSTVVWDTKIDKDLNIFQWQDLSNDSIFVINNPGQYFVKITDTFGCSYNSDTLNVTIDNFSSLLSLGNDLSLCAGNYISLTSGLSSSLTYTWSTGSNNSSLQINTLGQYSVAVAVTNTNNCVAKDTINIDVVGFAPTANFTTNTGCINSLVSFTDLSSPPSGNTITSYNWNFGDASSGAANTSTLTNPSHTYTNIGTYSVSLRVTTNAGCEQTTIKTLTVFPKPTVNFVSGNSCQNDSTAFSSLCTSVAGYSITSLNWNFGDPGPANTSNLTNPKHVFGNQANYTIKLVATNNVGCKDSLINIIAVKAQVKSDFTYSSPCTNTTTVFQDNSIVPAPNSSNTRTWNFGILGTSNSLTPSKTYTSSGVYYVTLSVTGNNGCNSSVTKLVTIFSPPIASFSVPTICAKDTFTITNTSLAQSGIISTNDWKLNNSYFSSALNPTLSINAAGTYSVKLTTTNSFGCENSATTTISVNAVPNVDFTTVPSSYYYINSPITLTPNISNALSYLWNISNYVPTSIYSPTVTYANEGDYSASLFLVDQSGCKNSITKTLTVSKRFLDVAILNVISNKDDDGFITVQTDIANYGSIPVSMLDLNYQVSDGGNIKETWNGILNPSSFFSYTFSSKTSTQLGSTNNITCVEIKKVNTINDENASNNKLCGSLNSDEISVSNPIPNPTNADITLPIILNKDIDITISIYNATGQIQYEETTQKGITGLNLISLPTSKYSRGCYIIKTNIDDKVFIKKFIKISNE